MEIAGMEGRTFTRKAGQRAKTPMIKDPIHKKHSIFIYWNKPTFNEKAH